MVAKSNTFVLFDGHGLIYRAYHAFPPLTSPDGTLVNAVYGFSRILLTAFEQLRPEYVAVAFDHKERTLREQTYAEYKAHRPEMPDDLKPQIELVKEVVNSLNVPQFELAGYEADDLIGTITHQLDKEPQIQTKVVTGDKDLLQLVNEQTHVWIPARGKQNGDDTEYDAATVKDKMGVTPEQIVDMKALMGDSSDNIPGVKGIGQKTAVKLIQAYGSLEGVYQQLETVEKTGQPDKLLKGAVITKLQSDKENAFLSKELAQIQTDVPIDFSLEPCRTSSYDKEKVTALFEKLQFNSLISRLPKDDFELGLQDALF